MPEITDEQPAEGLAEVLSLRRQGPTARLCIDRPATRNAISLDVMGEFEKALEELESDPPAVLVIRGGGDRVFVSGGDLKELAQLRTIPDANSMAVRMRHVLDRVTALPSTVVAELNGDAYGGGAEVAMAADFRLCADDIRIGFTQITLGIMPAWGGVERLAALVGRSRALYLLTTGAVVDAAQAYAWGLVDEIVPRSEFDDRCHALTTALAAAPAPALRAIKRIVSEVAPSSHPASEVEAAALFAETWVSEAHWQLAEAHDRRRRRDKEELALRQPRAAC